MRRVTLMTMLMASSAIWPGGAALAAECTPTDVCMEGRELVEHPPVPGGVTQRGENYMWVMPPRGEHYDWLHLNPDPNWEYFVGYDKFKWVGQEGPTVISSDADAQKKGPQTAEVSVYVQAFNGYSQGNKPSFGGPKLGVFDSNITDRVSVWVPAFASATHANAGESFDEVFPELPTESYVRGTDIRSGEQGYANYHVVYETKNLATDKVVKFSLGVGRDAQPKVAIDGSAPMSDFNMHTFAKIASFGSPLREANDDGATTRDEFFLDGSEQTTPVMAGDTLWFDTVAKEQWVDKNGFCWGQPGWDRTSTNNDMRFWKDSSCYAVITVQYGTGTATDFVPSPDHPMRTGDYRRFVISNPIKPEKPPMGNRPLRTTVPSYQEGKVESMRVSIAYHDRMGYAKVRSNIIPIKGVLEGDVPKPEDPPVDDVAKAIDDALREVLPDAYLAHAEGMAKEDISFLSTWVSDATDRAKDKMAGSDYYIKGQLDSDDSDLDVMWSWHGNVDSSGMRPVFTIMGSKSRDDGPTDKRAAFGLEKDLEGNRGLLGTFVDFGETSNEAFLDGRAQTSSRAAGIYYIKAVQDGHLTVSARREGGDIDVNGITVAVPGVGTPTFHSATKYTQNTIALSYKTRFKLGDFDGTPELYYNYATGKMDDIHAHVTSGEVHHKTTLSGTSQNYSVASYGITNRLETKPSSYSGATLFITPSWGCTKDSAETNCSFNTDVGMDYSVTDSMDFSIKAGIASGGSAMGGASMTYRP